jgi:dimethylaniline monooxygenase (N-oxide forming)
MHAKEYTDFRGFEDQNVLLVGIGNSALDIAVELTKVARSVTVSTRRGAWIFNRVVQVRYFNEFSIIFNFNGSRVFRNTLKLSNSSK